jgi:macrodomain Ter protein organizer (MatP/YcbG family)
MGKKITVELEEGVWQELRIHAIRENKTLQDVVKKILQKAIKTSKKEKVKNNGLNN